MERLVKLSDVLTAAKIIVDIDRHATGGNSAATFSMDFAIGKFNEIPAATSWISVDKKLPEEFVSVLLYVREEPSPVFEGYLVKDEEFGLVFVAHNKMHGDYGYCRIRSDVTHWMPMPEPPGKDDE